MSRENDETDKYLGRLTAQEVLLRELWFMFIKLTDQPETMAKALHEMMVSSVEKSDRFSADVPSARRYATTQAAIAHLDNFWDSVATRLNEG